MVGHSTDLPTHVSMKFGRSNMADKCQKWCFFLNFNHELWAIGRKLPKFCNCSEKLHMQGYKVGHSTDLHTHVAMKCGGSNMADKWQKECFFNFNHELWAIGSSCQNFATAVRNYISRATWWAIVPIYPPTLQ